MVNLLISLDKAIKMTSAGAWLREDQFIYWITITNANEIFQDYVYTNNAIYGISHPP